MTNYLLSELAALELATWKDEAHQATLDKLTLLEQEGLEPDALDLQALEQRANSEPQRDRTGETLARAQRKAQAALRG